MGYEMDVLESLLSKNKKANGCVMTLLELLGLAPMAVPSVYRD